MTIEKAALVGANGVVVNSIVYDPDAGYEPAEGLTLVVETEATGPVAIGGTWDGSTFTPPARVEILPGPDEQLV